ncbi:MAG: hypothetical protein BWY84_00022 [Candidatus Aerophobetes bacterium ADurb.Bin490]|nr:MAG: hypothetical protein BWY84_00022 [Candidatus Aerophobetes bacterium ADurb.Bin490]
MATEQDAVQGYTPTLQGTFKASGAITKGMICKFKAAGTVTKCGAGEAARVVACEAVADGKYGQFTILGGGKIAAGAAIATPGTWLKSDANGQAIAATTDEDAVIGYSVGVAGAANDLIAAVILPGFYSAA